MLEPTRGCRVGREQREERRLGSGCAALRAAGTPRAHPCRSGVPKNTFTRHPYKNRVTGDGTQGKHAAASPAPEATSRQRTHRPRGRDPGRPPPARPAGAAASGTARRTTSQRRDGPRGHTGVPLGCADRVRKTPAPATSHLCPLTLRHPLRPHLVHNKLRLVTSPKGQPHVGLRGPTGGATPHCCAGVLRVLPGGHAHSAEGCYISKLRPFPYPPFFP